MFDRSGDMEQLYEAYVQDVYRFLFSRCGDADLAEELTQETFFRAISSIGRFRGECSMKSWLFQIARHCLYRQWNRNKREKSVELTADLFDAAFTPEDDYVARESVKHLYQNILKLPENMRETVLLRLSGDLSFREIGEVQGKSENWARVTFFRAKQRLMETDKE